ncbi:glycosyltransferase family 2 protein [Pandoraea sp.]|uniref:glycosyltransferase family 2 protein n=1 Tax=Pandoraea sp. TaxID=1883445 RepID=UPI001209C101|nr:glycosyltransferase family 2 protein [Pandoraea sp.]TAL55375.1 MAG: glycosyltransferase family 2 protein [Pandoraea sp.]
MNFFTYVDCFSAHNHIQSLCVYDGGGYASPDVSIVIPTFRRPALLEHALLSALNQECAENYEVIVVDNDGEAQDKETWDIIQKHKHPRLRYFRNSENLGMFGNWNRGLLLARGHWVTILHDDDVLAPDFLRTMRRHYLAGDASRRLLSCEISILDERSSLPQTMSFLGLLRTKLTRYAEGKLKERVLDDYFYGYPHSGTLGIVFHRESAISLGGFNHRDYPSADYFFFTKYVERYGSAHLVSCLGTYRIAKNESLRDEVMVAWIKQGYEFRCVMSERHYPRSRWRRFLCKVITISQAYQVRKAWGGRYDVPLLLRSINSSLGMVNPIIAAFYGILSRIRMAFFYIRQN